MNRSYILVMVSAVLLSAVMLVAGCSSLPLGSKPTAAPPAVPTEVPTPLIPAVTTVLPDLSSCGFTSCHGPDIACGLNAPQVCTAEYKLGDRCRRYARCDTSGGSCVLVTSPEYTSCKACVQQCELRAGDDTLSGIDCEEKC